ncbi:MAG: SapC family protein, partial [Sphingopyxis sp.]
MATVPNLPLFFNDLVPLSAGQHADWSITTQETAPFLANTHAVPVTVDEFIMAGRFFPIVFSSGEQSVPLALMGLNEGVNVFVEPDGKLAKPVYVPAYVRRYPFLLAKLRPDNDELSLCFDPTAPGLGADGGKGSMALFDGDQPSKATTDILEFCRQFEEAGARTQAFMDELNKLDILMDGEVAIQTESNENPYIYRGFRMVDEEKLRDLRGDSLR